MASLRSMKAQAGLNRATHVSVTRRSSCLKCTAVHEKSTMRQMVEKIAVGLATSTAVCLMNLAPINELTPPAEALLTAGNPISNAKAILRYALPINNKPIRAVQRELESISEALRIPGSKSLGPVSRAINNAKNIITKDRNAILADVAPEKKDAAAALLEQLGAALTEFQQLCDSGDKQEVPIKQQECLNVVGEIEEAMVKGFPFKVPDAYATKPLLLGRASLEMKVDLSDAPPGEREAIMSIVLDGYNAPVTAGNFADLVARKFYDGMEIQRADGFVVQTGQPEGAEGFIDADTKEVRRIPLEIRVTGDKEPVYDLSLEDLGRFNEQPVLPFNAYGTIAAARAEFDNNSASSQMFFLLKESELTPASANLLDGRYAVFGYVVSGQDSLGQMKVGDKIEYIKFVGGKENLVNGP